MQLTSLPPSLRPYAERAPVAAFFLGVSSGFPYAMIGATLTTRLAQNGISKRAVTAFALAFLVYNLKWLWAWMVDGVRLPAGNAQRTMRSERAVHAWPFQGTTRRSTKRIRWSNA